ncbi:MAG: acyl-homoserine-lactone acylase [Halieaceae bacterium]|jgi:acyl-homoserine-lactone acylase
MSRLFILALSALLTLSCSDSSNNSVVIPQDPIPLPEPEPTYSAEIVWTEYGIPHVTADDWAGLGYGLGHAFATHNYCPYMRDVVRANGQSAELLGEDGNINFDFVMKLYNTDDAMERSKSQMSERGMALFEGYAAGISRYFRDTGVDNLAEGEEGCRGETWAREITLEDVLRSGHKTILRASADPFHNELVAATPPTEEVASANRPDGKYIVAARAELGALTPQAVSDSLGLPAPEVMGSNAYGIGRDASAINSGVLYGNPHFPWQGVNRFYMAHHTIPGVYDVMGAGLFGIPLANIGFNKDTAWSHTVSTARRFSLHELTLNPENPLEYLYDGAAVALEPLTVSTFDSSGAVAEHTFYISQFGPIADLGGVSQFLAGWPTITGTVFAFNDANKENLRGLETWINFGLAENLDEILAATKTIGIPWVNTIAADRHGEGMYADISVVPHATNEKINTCVRGFFGPILLDNGVVSLDGSDSACDLGSDDGAPAHVLGFDNLPKFRTLEYGANANDSYWLPNPRNLITGFSQAIGKEEYQQSIRTRLAFVQAEERLAGTDDLEGEGFTNQHVRDILYSSRNLAAELVNDDVVAACKAVEDWSVYSSNPESVAQACTILGEWDTRHTIDSVGGHVFTEFWRIARSLNNVWAVPFDPGNPVYTPNTLNVADADVLELIRQALADSVQLLEDNGIALNLPWGEVQYIEKNGERLPLPGGSGGMLFSVISSDLIEGEGYSNPRAGNSYIQAVSWDESDCPDANAVLTYSQSTDPASPNYADTTKLYSQSAWIDMPFCQADIEAQEVRRETIEE